MTETTTPRAASITILQQRGISPMHTTISRPSMNRTIATLTPPRLMPPLRKRSPLLRINTRRPHARCPKNGCPSVLAPPAAECPLSGGAQTQRIYLGAAPDQIKTAITRLGYQRNNPLSKEAT